MYNIIYSILNSKFELVKGDIKDYFYDEQGQIVATVDEKSITMFYSFPECSREIWNHNGKVAISFAKDFNINGRISDIIFIDGLCGASNDVHLHEDYAINTGVNSEMVTNPAQKAFNKLSNEEKIRILEKRTGCKATGANLRNVCLFGSDERIGNCGNLYSSEESVSFDICGLIQFENCRAVDYTEKIAEEYRLFYPFVYRINPDEQTINIISKKEQKDTNYDEIYKYYRKINDWHYKADYNTAGSSDTRDYVSSKRRQTIDERVVHKNVQISFAPELIREILENQIFELYTSSEQRSLNSTRLLIAKKIKDFITELKSTCNCADVHIYVNKCVNSILKDYNFNQRKVDITKKSKKQKRLSR